MTKTVSVLILGGFITAAAYATVTAQATKSVNDGVYTAEQAQRGEAIYKEQCAACHGDNLEGAGPMPPLAGMEKTHTSMPATAPGSLTPEQAAEVTAYQLMVSKYPAGTEPLDTKMETLLQITLDPPK
jgi:mono/diheme cytochrome c family protein